MKSWSLLKWLSQVWIIIWSRIYTVYKYIYILTYIYHIATDYPAQKHPPQNSQKVLWSQTTSLTRSSLLSPQNILCLGRALKLQETISHGQGCFVLLTPRCPNRMLRDTRHHIPKQTSNNKTDEGGGSGESKQDIRERGKSPRQSLLWKQGAFVTCNFTCHLLVDFKTLRNAANFRCRRGPSWLLSWLLPSCA